MGAKGTRALALRSVQEYWSVKALAQPGAVLDSSTRRSAPVPAPHGLATFFLFLTIRIRSCQFTARLCQPLDMWVQKPVPMGNSQTE